MNYTIHKDEFPLNQLVYKLVERKIEKIDLLLSQFSPDMLDLKINIELIPYKTLYIVSLVLSTPNQVLRSEKKSKDVMEAMGTAFDTLIREIKKFKDKLRKEYTYRDQSS